MLQLCTPYSSLQNFLSVIFLVFLSLTILLCLTPFYERLQNDFFRCWSNDKHSIHGLGKEQKLLWMFWPFCLHIRVYRMNLQFCAKYFSLFIVSKERVLKQFFGLGKMNLSSPKNRIKHANDLYSQTYRHFISLKRINTIYMI